MPQSTSSRAALALLGFATVGYFAYTFVWFALPAFLTPLIDAFSLSNAEAGLLAGAVPLMYIPLGLLSGVLIDRVGSRWGIGIGWVLVGVAQVSRSVSTEFVPMLLATLLLGIGGTGFTFGLPKLLADLFDPERIGSLSSVYIVGSSLGIAAAFSVGRGVLGPLLGGWRPVFLVTGAVTLGLGVGWLLLARALDRERRTVGEPTEALDFATLRRDVGQVAGNRNVRLLVVIGTMYLLVLHGLQGWLVTVLEVRGIDAAVAAGIASLFVVGQIAGTVLMPVVAERTQRKRTVVAVGGTFATIGSLALVVVQTPLTALLAVGVVGVGIGGLMPLIVSFPAEMDDIGAGLTATAIGLVFAVGEIGGFGGPFVIGLLRDRTGSFVPGLLLVALGGVVVVAAAFALRGVNDGSVPSPNDDADDVDPVG